MSRATLPGSCPSPRRPSSCTALVGALAAGALAAGALAAAGCTSREPATCGCTKEYAPVCGADGRTYANDCYAGCAGVTVAHPSACVPTACAADADCLPDTGCICGARCRHRDDPATGSPDGGCMLGCPTSAEPFNCGCVAGQCVAGDLPLDEPCAAERDRCAPATMCCPRCCGVAVDGGPQVGDYRCTHPLWEATGPRCPPVP